MKKQFVLITSILACPLIINWSEEHTIAGRGKPKINFYGILETHSNKKYDVKNITIGHMYKQIPLYDYPAQDDFDPETKKLHYNPKDRTKRPITRIDLSEVAELQVDPQKQWYFQRKGGRKIFFVPLTVISDNPQKTQNKYLIETTRTIALDKKIPDGKPVEMDVPPKAIKRLIIKGYKEQDTKKQKVVKKKN